MGTSAVHVDPRSIVVRRNALGLSRAEAAAAAGLSERTVEEFEDGRLAPDHDQLGQLAGALKCQADDLLAPASGTETLEDLRRAAGLTRALVSARLREAGVPVHLQLLPRELAELEQGSTRGAPHRDDPTAGELLEALAGIYQVPVRMVLDAWMRSRPNSPAPRLPEGRTVESDASAMRTWDSLNQRQQAYLEEIFREDKAVAVEARFSRLTGEVPPPARVWRRLPLAVSSADAELTRLQMRLVRRGIRDTATGTTVHALSRRGLVEITEDEVDLPDSGPAARVLVELTRRGRAAARAGTGTVESSRPAEHLLSEWLWGVVARVARAEPDGLAENELAGRSLFFLGVGYRNRAGGRPSRGLIDAVPVMAAEATHVIEYRWRLTPLGKRHVAEYLTTYKRLYPQVATDGIVHSPGSQESE